MDDGVTSLDDAVEEARRLVGLAAARNVPLRITGGVAVWMRAPSLRAADPPREFHDIDLAGSRRSRAGITELLARAGYDPHRRFNTLAGGARLMFHDRRTSRRVDVFLDRMEMCHTLEFADRLMLEAETLPLADLLLSKLQIVRLTDRDVVDVGALLSDHQIADRGAIELARIRAVCCGDWGWWRTVTGNLEKLEALWAPAGVGPGPDRQLAVRRAVELRAHLEEAPKTMRWKVRAAVGERVPWYQEPEEVR